MVEWSEDGVLSEDDGWVFDVLLLDAFDGSDGIGVALHLGFVNSSKSSSSHDLPYFKGYLLYLIVIFDGVLATLHKELFLDVECF